MVQETSDNFHKMTETSKLIETVNCKLIEIENWTEEKLSKQSGDEEREAHYKELIAAISRIAISGSVAHERRWSEIIRTVKTLDQLTEALNKEGYSLKRWSV